MSYPHNHNNKEALSHVLLSIGGESLSDNRVLSPACSNRLGIQGDVTTTHEIT